MEGGPSWGSGAGENRQIMLYYHVRVCAGHSSERSDIMDSLIVGASQPYAFPDVGSIFTGRPRQWAYSPDFVNTKLIISTRITLTGRRSSDYVVAENRTGQAHVPRMTVWHHRYDYNFADDTDTMQLVRYQHHLETIPHSGGCIAYADQHHTKYRSVSPEDCQEPVPCALQQYSAKELEDFAVKTALKLSTTLRRFYGGDFQLSQTALLHAARQDCLMDCILPLQDRDGASLEQVHRDLADKIPALTQMHAIGMDACGNFFCADPNDGVLFYDHEQDRCFDTELSLQDLMN